MCAECSEERATEATPPQLRSYLRQWADSTEQAIEHASRPTPLSSCLETRQCGIKTGHGSTVDRCAPRILAAKHPALRGAKRPAVDLDPGGELLKPACSAWMRGGV